MATSTPLEPVSSVRLVALPPAGLTRIAEVHATWISLVLSTLLILGDFLTGIEIAFTLLYVAPVALAAWFRGRPLGLLVAGYCIVGATGTEIFYRLQHRWPLHPYRMSWNFGGSFVLLALGVHVVVRLRAYADKEARDRRTAVEQLRQAERLGVVGQLASGIAHELGTPLNVIVGHAELFELRSQSPALAQASSAAILAQAEKMSAIIRGLLDFSRRSGGAKEPLDLATVANAAVELLRPIAKKRDIDLSIDLVGSRRSLILGNRTEVEQVLVNILMNGVQAMPGGGALKVRVRESAQREGTQGRPFVCVEIEDQGEGIPAELLQQIFDPFFTTKDVGEGTGLGLSVSYGIVSDHGGRIQVASTLGAGSRFLVYLPLLMT